MSDTSFEDIEKDGGREVEYEKQGGRREERERVLELTEGEEDLVEACEPPFTVHEELHEKHLHDHAGSPLEQTTSKPSVNNIKSVPNGGLTAWLQVLASFFLFWNTWGIINTFGTYQTYYEDYLLKSSSPSDISWIGSLQATLLMLIGTFSGPIYDAGYVHHLLVVGSVLAVLGQMMLSLCTEYWQVFLAQALCQGIGCGCLFVPAVSILSTYFSTRIATAVGLAASGSSLGGVVYPIVFHKLQPHLGFAWTTRILGFLMLATLAISCSVMRVRVLPAGRRKFLDLSAFTEAPYVLFVAGMTLCFAGLYEPFFYAQSEAIQRGLMSSNLAFYLLSIINAPSTFGRIIPGFIGDNLGALNTIIPCSMMTGVICLCLIAVNSEAGMITALAFYGFFCGALVSMPPTIFVHLTKNRAVIGTRIGMGFGIISMGLLVGTPISGAILSATGSYAYVWVWGGILTVVGTLLLIASRILHGGWNISAKA
jgi:MFS family permease